MSEPSPSELIDGRIAELGDWRGDMLARVRAGGVQEICLATNPDLEGEGTAALLAERLRPLSVRVTRLARGIPAGASIVQVSSAILADAIEGRRDLQ